MKEQDWDLFKEKLVRGSREAIISFSNSHPDEEICYFAYDCQPSYGYVLTCFNTTDESLRYVSELQEINVQRGHKILDNDRFRHAGYYYVKSLSVSPHCNNTGDFKYQGYTQIFFPEWEEYSESDEYPENEKHQDDYLESRVALIFWHALTQLVDEGAFSKLKLASPTLIGFMFHDEQEVVVRILNIQKTS